MELLRQFMGVYRYAFHPLPFILATALALAAYEWAGAGAGDDAEGGAHGAGGAEGGAHGAGGAEGGAHGADGGRPGVASGPGSLARRVGAVLAVAAVVLSPGLASDLVTGLTAGGLLTATGGRWTSPPAPACSRRALARGLSGAAGSGARHLALVDRRFAPILLVPAVMIANRPVVGLHTRAQSVGGLVLGGSPARGSRGFWSAPLSTSRTHQSRTDRAENIDPRINMIVPPTERMTRDRPVDVNERVIEEWRADTTPGERVRTVVKRTYDPQSVATIAERALTTETTARKHLGVLAEDGFVEAVSPPDERGTRYRRAPRSVVLERAQQLLDSVDVETLSTRVTELRQTIREFEDETAAESPRAAAIADAEVDAATMTEWRTARRNLKLARAAIALADATDAVGDDGGADERGEPAGVIG